MHTVGGASLQAWAPVGITGWYRAVFTSYLDDAGNMQAVGFFQDIDSEVQHRLKLQHLANMDGHTEYTMRPPADSSYRAC